MTRSFVFCVVHHLLFRSEAQLSLATENINSHHSPEMLNHHLEISERPSKERESFLSSSPDVSEDPPCKIQRSWAHTCYQATDESHLRQTQHLFRWSNGWIDIPGTCYSSYRAIRATAESCPYSHRIGSRHQPVGRAHHHCLSIFPWIDPIDASRWGQYFLRLLFSKSGLLCLELSDR